MVFYFKKNNCKLFNNIAITFILKVNNFKFKFIDNYNILHFALSGLLIWLNLLHINIIIVKHSFLILLNNLEYLIIFKIWKLIINLIKL